MGEPSLKSGATIALGSEMSQRGLRSRTFDELLVAKEGGARCWASEPMTASDFSTTVSMGSGWIFGEEKGWRYWRSGPMMESGILTARRGFWFRTGEESVGKLLTCASAS